VVDTQPLYSVLFLLNISDELVQQPTYAFNKTHSEASIKLLHVSAPECHHQGVILNKGVQGQHAYLGIGSPLLK
jgi:hypothetical protein